jgi:hypothetical protein
LFDREYYSQQVERAGAPGLDRFASHLAHYAAIGAALDLRPDPLVDHDFCRAQIDIADHPGFEPVAYYLQVGRFVGFTTHPLIDKAHYIRVRGGLAVDEDPLADHLLVGAEQGLSLHPLFDAAWYLETNHDVRAAGCDPLRHYLAYGDAEGRWPNPLFDPAFYRTHAARAHASVAPAADLPALTHYVCRGRDGARTHVLFDGVWYLQRNADVRATGIDPLEHYLGSGGYENRTPHPLFDTKYLLEQHPSLLRHHRNPLIAFLRSPIRVHGSPHPLFDPAHYIAQVPAAADAASGPFEHFMCHAEATFADPHPLFCTRFYREQRAASDAIADRSGAPAAAGDPWDAETNDLLHFIAAGSDHGLRPHPLFDPTYYLENHLDVRASGINPLAHFISAGGNRIERRQPHRLFDTALYAKRLATRELAPGNQLAAADLALDERQADQPASCDSALDPRTLTDSSNLLLDFLVNWRDRPSPHVLFDLESYAARLGEDAGDADPDDVQRHPNPLVDYVWKGRAARRPPHPLFDPTYYEAAIDVPASWRETLLEHYLCKLAPESFLPHPALDGEYVVALIGSDDTTNATLLEAFVSGLDTQELSPHIGFASCDYRLLSPPLAGGSDHPFTAYLREGGIASWLPNRAARGAAPAFKRLERACQAAKVALCGIGGLGAVSPPVARGRALRHRLSARAVSPAAYRIISGLSPHHGSSAGKVAIYAASANPAADAVHAHALAALKQAGFTIVFVAAQPDQLAGSTGTRDRYGQPSEGPGPLARPLVDALLVQAMGNQHIGAWVLACRLFAEPIATYDQVLFLSDNLVGPIGPAERLFDSLAAGAGWWGVTHADQSSGSVDAELFALSAQVMASAAFQTFITDFTFADTATRVSESAEHELSRALRAAGFSPTLLAPADDLRAGWLHALPAKLRWFRDLADQPAPDAGAAQSDSALCLHDRIARYAETWLRARVQNPRYGGRIRPSLLFWDVLIDQHHMPFVRRDLLTINPIDDPALLRLRDLLGAESLALLHRLIAPTLPDPACLAHPPVLRLGLAPAIELTRVARPARLAGRGAKRTSGSGDHAMTSRIDAAHGTAA